MAQSFVAKRPALLLVDLFNLFDFKDGGKLARQALGVSRRIRLLRECFDSRGFPVIHANDNFLDWTASFADLLASCRANGGVSAALATELAPSPHHCYLLKPRHSAFLGTPLPLMLNDLRADGLVIAGFATDSCILVTAQEAKMRGIPFLVPHDVTAAITPARKRAALQLMRSSLLADTRGSRRVMQHLAST